MPQPFVSFFLLQSVPLARIAHPSQGRQLPCGYPPTLEDVSARPYQQQFRRRPRSHALAEVPCHLWAPFPCAEAQVLVPLDTRGQDRLVLSASPTSKPSSSHESVHDVPSCPVTPADPLLGFVPSEVFSSHAWGPRTRPSASARARDSVRRPRLATQGPCDPCARGTRQRTHVPNDESVDGFQPVPGWPEPPLGGSPPPMALDDERTRRS